MNIRWDKEYHEHREIRRMPCHAEHCGFQVALVASQIYECDHLKSHKRMKA